MGRLLPMSLAGVLSIEEHDLQLTDPQLNLDENDLPRVVRVCGGGFCQCHDPGPNLLLLSIFRRQRSHCFQRPNDRTDLLL